jgi:hypothetical protein
MSCMMCTTVCRNNVIALHMSMGKAARYFEIQVYIYQTTRRHIPEDSNHCDHRPADLKCDAVWYFCFGQ